MSPSLRQCAWLALGLSFSALPTAAHAEDAKPAYALTDTLHLPGPTRWDALTFEAAHHRLFITHGDSVDVLDTQAKTIVATIASLSGVHAVALAPEFNKGFITEGKADRVAIFDLATLKVVATAPTGKKPDLVFYDEASKRAFAADGESRDLTAIDAASGAVVGTIALEGKPEFIAADGKGRLYVNLADKAQIAVVDAAVMKVLAHFELAPACESPTGLAMDQAGGRLFAVCGNKTMVIVDAASGKIIDAVPIGQHSDGAAFDPATGLAFSSNGEGTLTIVGASETGGYKVLQTVTTKPTARTMALDPTTHTIYLAAAETEAAEPATAEKPEPRPRMKPDTFMILIVSRAP
jgi:DNA-binding beta-propeller fold protein YncE